MNSKTAIKMLIKNGYTYVRNGKGDHIILQRKNDRIIISGGKTELSSGMTKKVKSKAFKL